VLVALWRQLVADRVATVSSLLAVAIAIGAIVAVHLLSARLASQVAANDAAHVFGVTHWWRSAELRERDYFALRARWRAGALSGVAALVPVVDANIVAEGKVYALLGFDPLALVGSDDGSSGNIVRADSFDALLTSDTVLAHASTGLRVGSTIELSATHRCRGAAQGCRAGVEARVIDSFGDPDVAAPWLVTDIATAQRALGTPERLTAIGARIDEPERAWQRVIDALFPGVRRATTEVVVLDGKRFIPAGDGELGRFSGSILYSLGVLSLLSALVAAFLVYQNTRSHVARRGLLLRRLDALGAPQPLVDGMLLLEGLAIAWVGAAIGIALGVFGADMLLRLVAGGAAQEDQLAPSTAFDAWVIGKAVAVATAVAFGATYLARRDASGTSRFRAAAATTVAGSVLVAVGVGIGASAVTGAFCAIAGLCLLAIVALTRWVSFGTNALLSRPGVGLFSTLNLRQARAAGPNVNAALAALLLAVATAIGMGEMVQSFHDAFVAALDRRLSNDLVVESDVPIDAAAASELVNADDVARATPYIEAEVFTAANAQLAISATDLSETEAARYGYDSAPEPGAVLVNEQAARSEALRVGGTLRLSGARGTSSFTVAAVFRDYGAVRPRIVMDVGDARRLIDLPPARRFGIRLREHGDATTVHDVATHYGWRVTTRDEVRTTSLRTFARTFAVSDALVVVALLVAVIGMGTAFALLELSRGRELRLLDVLGVSDGRRLAMTVTQVAVLAGLVMSLAIPLGLAIGWILCAWLNPAGFGWSIPFQLYARPIVVSVTFGFAAALIAGIVPMFADRGMVGVVR
jgi:putative ABC transport system permease protein